MLNLILDLKQFADENIKINFNTGSLWAADGFSFSCYKLDAYSQLNEIYSAHLRLNRFQLQPFQFNSTVFADSFDCSTWFTIPTWMGFITVSLFASIISIGIYFLFEIKTMDRFENPKSKPIAVPTSE